MKENFLELYNKLKTYRAAVLSATFFVFLCFGIMLVTNTISIDEHIAIFSRSYNDPFLAYGRFGIRLFYMLFAKFGKYAPLYFDVFTLIFIILSAFVFYITLFKKNTSPLYCFLFISYYCSIPFVFANFMSFSQQSLPISIGMFFISLVIYFIDTKKPLLVPCSLLLFISFSFYQALIGTYLVGAILLIYKNYIDNKYDSFKDILEDIKTISLVFVCGFTLYYLVNSIIFIILKVSTGSYLNNYIGWFEDPQGPLHALFYSLANVIRIQFAITIFGVEVYGGLCILFASVLGIIYALNLFIKEKKIKTLLFNILLFISPFLMYILMGTYKTQGRVLLGLPLLSATYIILFLSNFKNKTIKTIVYILIFFVLFKNGYVINRLYFSDYTVRKRDDIIYSMIVHDIAKEGINVKSKPIVLIGIPDFITNEHFDSYSTLGGNGSFFYFNDGFVVQNLIAANNLGFTIQGPSLETINEAYQMSKNITSYWPKEGSIVEGANFILVNLGKVNEQWLAAHGITNP